MRKVALIAIAIIVVAGAAAAALWSSRPKAPIASPTSDMDDKDDAQALAASQGLASRNGPALSFRMKNGEVLTLTDRVICGDLPCPRPLWSRYRYLGWDMANGGYRLQVTMVKSIEMILPFTEGDPVLVDARHVEPPPDAPIALPSPPAAAGQDDSLTEWLADIGAGRLQSEAPRIATSQGKASREGDNLALTLADGRHMVLADDLACGQMSCPPQVFRSFDYAGSSPDRRYHVVAQHWDEASDAMLIDTRNGNVTEMLGVPVFTPDGKRAAATVTDLEWSAPRRLEVWSFSGAEPGIEFSLSATEEDDTIYEIGTWTDADHLHLRRGSWSTEARVDAMLVHDAAGWHVENGEANN